MGVVSTQRAAEITGLHPETIRRLCRQGTIKAQRIGRVYVIDERALRKYLANPPKVGRPPKARQA